LYFTSLNPELRIRSTTNKEVVKKESILFNQHMQLFEKYRKLNRKRVLLGLFTRSIFVSYAGAEAPGASFNNSEKQDQLMICCKCSVKTDKYQELADLCFKISRIMR